MREDIQSIQLRQLNQEYLELFFNPTVRSAIRKSKLKWLDYLKIPADFIRYGRYMELKNKIKSKVSTTPLQAKYSFGIPFIKPDIMKNYKEKKVVVYTCIFGDYIEVQNPMYRNPSYDYYIITDSPLEDNCLWKTFQYESKDYYSNIKHLSPREKNRWFKLHPHLLFPDYEYSVYMDGRIRLIADVMPMVDAMEQKFLGVHLHATKMDCLYEGAKTVLASKKASREKVEMQMQAYKNEGYPKHQGLFENGILIRNHNNRLCIEVMEEWWNQLCKFTIRDQLSLNYVLWKYHVDKNMILILGDNIYKNPNFRFYEVRN